MTNRHGTRSARLILLISLFVGVQQAVAQLPATRLSAIFPPGSSVGKVVDLSLDGVDLDDVRRLLFSHPGIVAKQKMVPPGQFEKGQQPVLNRFLVSVGKSVPPGTYEVRAIGRYGTSNPRPFTVSDKTESLEVEPNNDRAKPTRISLPVVVNGRSNQAADVDFFKFKAAAGQRIIVSSHARRIGSQMDTVVTVYDAAGRQLGSSRDDLMLDSLVDFTAAATGEYFLKINDSSFQGGPTYGYRISIGVLPHIDFVFPPAGLAGGSRRFTIYGRNLPAGQPSGLIVKGKQLQKQTVSINLPGGAAAQQLRFASLLEPAAAGLDATGYRIKGAGGYSNSALIGIARSRPVLEVEPNNSSRQVQKIKAPCEVMGQFYPQRDRDWYELQAKKGQSFTIEVISRRMGVHSDADLLVQRVIKAATGDKPEQVRQVAFVTETTNLAGGAEFDVRHDDPTYRFTATVDGTYRLMVRDSFSEVDADPRRVYRLAIHNGQPDFRLAAVPEGSHSAALLRKGGQIGIRVVAFRRDGFAGEIRVSATGLPAGVTCQDAIIGPGSSIGMMTLSATAKAVATTSLITVVGKAKIGAANVTRTARFGAALVPTTARANASQLPLAVAGHVTSSLAVSVSASEAAPLTFRAGGGKVWETSRVGKLKIPFTRGGTFKGQINFVPRGLPNLTVRATNAAANKTSGEFQISLRSNSPIGTYTFYLDGVATQLNYRRNPEAAAAAAARKKEVDQIKAKAVAAAKASAAAKSAADRLVTTTSNAAKSAKTAQVAAGQALAAAQKTATTAAAAARRANAALAAKPTDAKLKTAVSNAQKAVTTAAAAVKATLGKATAAKKKVTDANTKSKAAAAAKVESDKKAAVAAKRSLAATQLQTKINRLATKAANDAKPRKRNVPIVSTPITIKITDAPIRLAQPKAPGPLKQGAKFAVPITITRLYKYKSAVNLTAVLPRGVRGLTIRNASIPANKNQSKLAVSVSANATPGKHTVTLRARMNLNGQNLTIEQKLLLLVVAVAKKKKK